MSQFPLPSLFLNFHITELQEYYLQYLIITGFVHKFQRSFNYEEGICFAKDPALIHKVGLGKGHKKTED